MPKVDHESPGKIGRRGGVLIYHRGPLAKISHQKWPFKTGNGWYSTYDNGNGPDIDTMRMHKIQQDRISELDVTKRPILFKPIQGYASRRQRGEFGYNHVPEFTHKCSPSPNLEAILARNLSEYDCPFQEKLGLPYNGSISLDQLPSLLPDSKSRAESPCFSQNKRTINEATKTDKPLYGIGKYLAPLSPVKGQTNSIPKKEEYSADKHTGLESLENPSTGRLHGVERNYEDQHFTIGVGRRGVSPAQLIRPLDSGEDPNEKVAQSKQSIQSDKDGGCPRKRWLACLWYKKDPLKYSSCAKYKLLRIKDVKQHTYRRHMKPDIYCSVCFKVFSKEKERDRHMQKKLCTPRSEPEFDGLSEQQRKELNQSANRGKDDVERWYCMWDTIFPSERRPLLPYLGVGRQELLPLLRSFWNQRHQDIIRNVLQRPSQRKVEPKMVQNVMDTIFDRFEAESLTWDSYPNEHSGDESSENGNSQTQSPGISNDVTIGDSPPQQDITDYGTLYEPSGYQPGLESNLPLEPMSENDFDQYLGIETGFDLYQYGTWGLY
ncbi:hypothetical protein F4813DRAFT_155999 [Daldinia decipiens]|uniref:uncharacterized protein n=1 Tax=Daldinia decipiens TaxID=326647 RepID=UPI0020C5259F|nr:uncharacterized protein F4813DRAFT_155999 [Daldinia decipiens]KAI1655577.1 hypothetical protein F4813DRAFT_155999 [Daldinia decipiens]